MKKTLFPGICVFFFSLIIGFSGCSSDHGGSKNRVSPVITVSGTVNDGDVSGAAVSLKRLDTDAILATATTGNDGSFSMSVTRSSVESVDYVLVATHPDNGRVLRSMVDGDDIKAADTTFSSRLTVVSAYTEAAFLTSKIENDTKSPLTFLSQAIRETDTSLHKSTGYDDVDAMASWLRARFIATATESDAAFTVNLIREMVEIKWPVLFLAATDVSISIPSELMEGGAVISVTSYDGPSSVTVSGRTITVTAGAAGAQGEVVLAISLDAVTTDLTLPVNTVGEIATSQQTIIAGDTTSLTFSNLVLVPSQDSFGSYTSVTVSQLDLSALSDTSIGDITLVAAFDIDLSREPEAPVTLVYQAQGSPDPDRTVLIHINSATKGESIIYPDSYDSTTNRFFFTLSSFSPVLIGTMAETPAYEAGTEITASDLESDSALAFAFFRELSDEISDEETLAAISSVSENTNESIRFLVLLSSKALSSFMDLPKTDPDALENLADTTFKPQWFSLDSVTAYDEYFTVRAKLMQALYRVANAPFDSISREQLLNYVDSNDVDIEEDVNSAVLGHPDDNDLYYPPMVARRALKRGLAAPDTFFKNALDDVDALGLDSDAYHLVCQGMADWISKYIDYKRYVSPKVAKEGTTATKLNEIRSSLISEARNFFSDPKNATYAALWLGGSYDYSDSNDISAAVQGFASINDTFDASIMFPGDDADIQARAKSDTVYPLGSSVSGKTWVDQGSYYIPPEVADEITNLNNWRAYLSSLLPKVSTWYRDADNDGFGNPDVTMEASLRPDGYVSNNSDPDDTNVTIYPNSREICSDGVDNDLNGLIDEGCSSHYKGTETQIVLTRKSNNQFLIPVDVGNQTFNLLVDTGSDALVVFSDKLAADTTVEVSTTPFTKRYASVNREGFLATAAVRLGAYYDPDMTIMVVTSPTSDSDPSLTAKEADGIIGLRRTQGISLGSGDTFPDPPFNTLEPAINIFELDLPPTGPASISLGHMTILDRAKSHYVFKAKTYTFEDPERPYDINYADLQVPFRAKSKFGEANTGDLDVLFDSGAVSKLVLDTQVAKSLGYDSFTETWNLDDDDEIEFNIVGADSTITIYPKFKVSEISVAPLSQMGVSYEAVLGIDRWQHYVVGFSYVDWQSEGPDGTILMLFRPNLAEAFDQNLPDKSWNYDDLDGLNSFADDRFPTADQTGELVAFQSNRPNGMGKWDIYLWRKGTGILTYPNLNSTSDDADPSISGDGRYLVFHSDREGGEGNWDIYLYDVEERVFIDTPGLNSSGLDRTPTISTDGRYIAFRSERDGGEGGSDIYLYDRETESLVDLPGLNSSDNDYDPVVNEDGTLIAFDHEYTEDGVTDSDIYLYNVATLTLDTLPYANWESYDMDTVISPDGTYISCHSNWHNMALGLYDRNFEIYNLETGFYETFPGLNSEFDEEGLCFTGNSQSIMFHSTRPGGMGGSDIYFYNLWPTTKTSDDTEITNLPDQDILITQDENSGAYTIPIITEDGETLTLLLDTGVSGVILFSDSAPTDKNCGGPASVSLPYGTLNAAYQVCMQITVGDHRADTMIPVISSQSQYNAITGRGDLPDVDGVIGFRGNFQNEFLPKILFIEFNFINGTEYGLDAKPGLTIGDTPMTFLARGLGEYVFDTYVDGVIDPIDPVNKSYTNMDVAFLAQTDTGEITGGGDLVMLSSVLTDTLILDFKVAKNLGYSEITGWGMVNEISLFFANDYYRLHVDMGAFPVSKVTVADLADQHCNAVLSAERWMDSFVVGFATIDYQFGGPWGTVSLIHIKDLPALEGDYLIQGRNYVALPGLNSESDEDYPTISIDGQTIAFQSTRNGDKDVFVYKIGKGLQDLPGLNSEFDDEYPYISGDGRLVVFHSDRTGDKDIYLYDIEARDFIDLPDLNTEYDESLASISADGLLIAFTSDREGSIEGSDDIYLYSLVDMALVDITGSWLNTEGYEYAPILTKDGGLLSIVAEERPDTKSYGTFILLYDLINGRLVELPEEINGRTWNDGVISVDGEYILQTVYPVSTGDIKLFERSSGEFIYLPGLNTIYEEWGLQASPNAQYIVFESDRPGGVGGWDIYVYKRDETDTNTYTVTTAYNQSGYVVDEDLNRMADEEIRAYDKSGELIGTAVTDGDGNFTLTVPQGSQLGITFESVTADLSIVTDDVGDDTYVPDFEAGNLKFTEVWIEDTAQAGLSSTIHFDIEATVPKYNTYVTVYLKAGNPGDFVVDDTFEPDYELTSLIIDKLGFKGEVTDPIVLEQKDLTTSVTYYPDTGNKKAYVEHTFVVPQGIADGVYTAVFAINTYDVTSEDDALQGESDEDLADNYMVASASTIIGNPTLPNLRILSYDLYTNSFELPAAEPDPDVVPEQYDLSLNLEVESMAQDTTLPVEITFDLVIGGTTYPMSIAETNEYDVLMKQDKQTYDVTCRAEDRDGYDPAVDHCASLYRQEQTGKTYSLFMNGDAYNALKNVTSDTTCYLTVKMDPDLTIDEYNDNLDDNSITLPIMFLAPESEATVSARTTKMTAVPGSTKSNLFNLRKGESCGNEDFGIGYEIGPTMDYMTVTYNGYDSPYAVNFDGTGKVTATLFGLSVTPLEVGPKFDFDFSDGGLENSYFDYGVWTFGLRLWGHKHTMPDDFVSEGKFTLWDTTDDQGNEKYAKRKEKKKNKTFMVGPVPLTVEGGVVGEIGIRGGIYLETGNKLSLEAGPYASLVGYLEASVGAPAFQVGVGIDLTLIDIMLKFNPSMMVKPEVPIAIFELRVPLVISTLQGKAYGFVRALFWTFKHSIISWEGLSYEINLFPVWYKGYGATDLYNVSYYSGSKFDGTSVAGTRTGFLSTDWGNGGPSELNGQVDYFSAIYEGYFEFSISDSYIWGDSSSGYGSDYTFYVDSDDYLTIKLDDEDILTNNFGEKQFTESIEAGFHKLTVNYRELTSPAYVEVYWTSPNQFATFYYNNTDMSGDPVLFETTDKIDWNLGDKSPKPGVVDADSFSIKYQGDFTFPVSTDYMFAAKGNDVVKIYVDNTLVLNNNGVLNQPKASNATITAGTHNVRVEYVKNSGNANLRVNWAPMNTYVGAYYNNRTFSNAPKRISNDSGYILADPGLWDHYFVADFGGGRPANDSNVNYDNFSAKWEGAFNFEGGDYEFVMGQDDELSVWVDDQLIGSYTTWERQALVKKYISPGWHIIRMNYVEHAGGAIAVLKWGKKQKNIVTEYYGRSNDEFGNLIAEGINRRNSMNYNWERGAPSNDWGLKGDNYTVIWEGDFDFEGAPYRFTSGGDDRVTVYMDNIKVVDAEWSDWNTHDFSMITMNQGTHHIKAVITENGGGCWAKVSWEKLEAGKFYAQKFDCANCEPAYAWDTGGKTVDYNWGSGSYDGNTDNYLIIFNGVFYVNKDATYTFSGSVDDDLRVYIDNTHVYHRKSWGTYTFTYQLKKGYHSIKLRYWEGGGGSHIQFNW